MLADVCQTFLLLLQGQLSVIKPEEKRELARLKAALSDRLTPTRDNNGFRKLLVVLSRAGEHPNLRCMVICYCYPVAHEISLSGWLKARLNNRIAG